MTTIKLHPVLAAELRQAINDRSVAATNLNDFIYREHFALEDWIHWRDEHIKATERLAELGVDLPTYTRKDVYT